MDILEHEHERPPFRHRLEEPTPRGERLALLAVAGYLRFRTDAGERPQLGFDPFRLGCVGDQVVHCGLELPVGFFGRVGLEHARLCFDHLAQRPVRDTLAIRKRTALAPVGEHAALLDCIHQLINESALPDSRDSDERDELGPALRLHAVERLAQQHTFSLSTDQRRSNLTQEVDAEP